MFDDQPCEADGLVVAVDSVELEQETFGEVARGDAGRPVVLHQLDDASHGADGDA